MVRAKLNSILSVLVLTFVLSLSGCAADVDKSPVRNVDAFFVVDDIQEARDDIEASGGRVVHIFPEDGVMIGEVSKGFKSKHVDAIYFSDSKLKPTRGEVFFDAWTKNLAYQKLPLSAKLAKIPKDAPKNPGEDVVSFEDGFMAQDFSKEEYNAKYLSTKSATTFDPLPSDTSLYMIGDVSVSIVLPESDASSSNTEDWTSEEITAVTSKIMTGLDWWNTNNPDAELSFIYDTYYQVPIDVEPIEMNGLDWWVYYTTLAMGYSGNYIENIYDHVNNRRDFRGTDWGFMVLVADSSNDADGKFLDGKFAFTNLEGSGGGPYTIMTYDNNGYGIENMDAVIAHELGHIFGAADQYSLPNLNKYCSCIDDVGYLNYENQNCDQSCAINESSIMKAILLPIENNVVDYYAMGQIGLVDSDANGILDIVDLSDNVLFNHTSDIVSSGDIFNYEGQGNIFVLPSENEWYNSVSINDVSNVQYTGYLTTEPETKVWNDATGSFGLPSVDYLFNVDTTEMPWGEWTFETKAITRFGDEVYDSDELSLHGCTGGDLDPKVKGTVASYDGTWHEESDTCIGSLPYSRVIQYTCDGTDIISMETRCYYGCSEGRCLNKVIPRPRVYMMEAVQCDHGENCDETGFLYR